MAVDKVTYKRALDIIARDDSKNLDDMTEFERARLAAAHIIVRSYESENKEV